MKKIVTILLVTLFACAALAQQQHVLYGTFIGLEMGDYAHVQIEDEEGTVHSFWLGNDPSLVDIVENPGDYEGRDVEVHWHTVTRDIPQAGGPMEIDEAVWIGLDED